MNPTLTTCILHFLPLPGGSLEKDGFSYLKMKFGLESHYFKIKGN